MKEVKTFYGKPCSKDSWHIVNGETERYQSTGQCLLCQRKYSKEHQDSIPMEVRVAAALKWVEENPDKRKGYYESNKEILLAKSKAYNKKIQNEKRLARETIDKTRGAEGQSVS